MPPRPAFASPHQHGHGVTPPSPRRATAATGAPHNAAAELRRHLPRVYDKPFSPVHAIEAQLPDQRLPRRASHHGLASVPGRAPGSRHTGDATSTRPCPSARVICPSLRTRCHPRPRALPPITGWAQSPHDPDRPFSRSRRGVRMHRANTPAPPTILATVGTPE